MRHICRCYITIFLLSGSSIATGNQICNSQTANDTSTLLIPEIVITAHRHEANMQDRPEAISKISSTDPNLGTATSTPNALAVVPGIWIQKTNLGGGSPFIRGLTGYHTLILIDGIRFNNSTFRSGPNQYLNTIDPLMVDKVEVMKGQGAVPYGSDALGGTIQLFSRSPDFSVSGKKIKGSVYGKMMSGGMEKTSRLEMEANLPHNAFVAGASIQKLGDIVAGKGLGTLNPTGYSTRSLDAKVKHMFNDRHIMTGAMQFLRQVDVPLYHKIAVGDYSTYLFDPQQRSLSYLRLESFYTSPLFSKIIYTVSHQHSLERRIKQKPSSSITDHEEDKVRTLNGSIKVISKPGDLWNITSGIEYYEDLVNSRTTSTDNANNNSTQRRGLYPDGSKARNLGIYSLHSLRMDQFYLTFGGRYNFNQLLFDDETAGRIKLSPSSLVGNAGLNYKISEGIRFAASASSGFRAPNINDVSSLGIADFRYEIPNYALKSEKSINLDIGFKFHYRHFAANFFLFRNRLKDLIVNVPSTYNGNDSIDGFRVYQRANLNKALIKGLEAEGRLMLLPALQLSGHITYTYGEDINSGSPLRRIPPVNSRLGMLYSHQGFRGNFEWVHAGKQTRLSQGDIDDTRIRDGGTLSWNVLNCSLGYAGKSWTMNAGVNNVFNEAYRCHGSGIDGIGRSFWVSFKVHYEWFKLTESKY